MSMKRLVDGHVDSWMDWINIKFHTLKKNRDEIIKHALITEGVTQIWHCIILVHFEEFSVHRYCYILQIVCIYTLQFSDLPVSRIGNLVRYINGLFWVT